MGEVDFDTTLGMSRRTLIRRGGVLAGALVWSAPVITSMSMARAAGSAPCTCTFCVDTSFGKLKCVPVDAADCNCLCNCAARSPVAECGQANPCDVQLVCAPDETCTV